MTTYRKAPAVEGTGAVATRRENLARIEEITGNVKMRVDTEIPEWDFKKVIDDDVNEVLSKTWFLLGKTGTGKSYFIRTFFFWIAQFVPYGWVFTHSKFNRFFQQFFPNNFIVANFDQDLLEFILELQKHRKNKRGLNSHIVVVLDDMFSDVHIRFTGIFRKLAMEGRHYNITTILTTQTMTTMATQVRENNHYTVLFRTRHVPTIKNISEELATDFATKEDLQGFLELNTKKHQCIVVDQRPTKEPEERYFKFTAMSDDECPPFVFGCDQMWGGPRYLMCRRQRKKMPILPVYAGSYLVKLYNRSNVTRQTMQEKLEVLKEDPMDNMEI